jgi:hypothetical protein
MGLFPRFLLSFIAFLNSPCYETPKNAPNKKQKKSKQLHCFLSPVGFFRHFFTRPSLRTFFGELAQICTSLSSSHPVRLRGAGISAA